MTEFFREFFDLLRYAYITNNPASMNLDTCQAGYGEERRTPHGRYLGRHTG